MSIRAILQAGQTQITVNGLHQWDYGRKLEIVAEDIPSIVEVHFACAGMTEAAIRTCGTIDGVAVAAIPDQCLEQTTPITAWVYAVGDTSGSTVKTITLPIIARTKPPMTAVPEGISDKYTEALAAFNDAVEGLQDGKLVALEAAHAAEADHAVFADRAAIANGVADTVDGKEVWVTRARSAENAGTAVRANVATIANGVANTVDGKEVWVPRAEYAAYAKEFASGAVAPRAARADVATMAEGVVAEINGEPVFVPNADYASSANKAIRADFARIDDDNNIIHLTYQKKGEITPIVSSGTSVKLNSKIKLGQFGNGTMFRNMTRIEIGVGGTGDSVPLFNAPIFITHDSAYTHAFECSVDKIAIEQYNTSDTKCTHTTWYLYGALTLENTSELWLKVTDINKRVFSGVPGNVDDDTWEQLDLSNCTLVRARVSFT